MVVEGSLHCALADLVLHYHVRRQLEIQPILKLRPDFEVTLLLVGFLGQLQKVQVVFQAVELVVVLWLAAVSSLILSSQQQPAQH